MDVNSRSEQGRPKLMLNQIQRYFEFEKHGANFRLEMLAGVTTFLTLSYIIVVNDIGVGIPAGFVLYPLFKLVAGRVHEIHSGLWVLAGLSLLFYIFYPYH